MNKFQNPLSKRYCSDEMSFTFSPQFTHTTWRKIWKSLAQGEMQLGVGGITENIVSSLEKHSQILPKEYEKVKEFEKEVRHDVMAHIRAFGLKVGEDAAKIIHLGATSCFVKDNTWLIQMKEGLNLLKKKLLNVIVHLKDFSLEQKELPTLGFTHFQPAQLVTVGKRAALWLQDFLFDFEEIESRLELLDKSFRGVKGTTGTQDSFLKLFGNDHEKVKKLDAFVTKEMGFKKSLHVTGQTYSRKIDYFVLSTLSSIAQTAYKFATDMRLLQNLNELEEPFGKKQVGSSAMAYKRNPMRCERICGLSRFVSSLLDNASNTYSNQWFERTLDDSSNRRLSIPQAFLACDGILLVMANVLNGIVVNKLVIQRNVMKNLPFMATEKIIIEACKKGLDRQDVHERIRELSMETIKMMKEKGTENDLIERLENDKMFKSLNINLKGVLEPSLYIGRSKEIVEDLIKERVDPILEKYKGQIKKIEGKLSV